jgi:hypothetical protein
MPKRWSRHSANFPTIFRKMLRLDVESPARPTFVDCRVIIARQFSTTFAVIRGTVVRSCLRQNVTGMSAVLILNSGVRDDQRNR